jgi:hypothetical protein
MQTVDSIKNEQRRVKMQELSESWVLGCPVIDVQDQIIGSIMVTWDVGDQVPDSKTIADLMPQIKLYGKQIGAALDVQRLEN